MTQRRRRLVDAVHLFVLCDFALAQPLFDSLSHRPAFLIDQEIGPLAISLVVLTLAVVIPGVLAALRLGAAWLLGERVGARVQNTLVCLLSTATILVVLRNLHVSGMFSVAASLAIAAAATFAYARLTVARTVVTAASAAIVIFPAVFLMRSPIASIFLPPPEERDTRSMRDPVPIVMVVFDEFCGTTLMDEHHQIDRVRYPNIAALADGASWFRNASSVHGRTDHAVPAILTGKYPGEFQRPTVADHPANLFTLLLATERYRMVVFEPFTRLFPAAADRDMFRPKRLAEQTGVLATTLPIVYLHDLFPSSLPFQLPDIPPVWYSLHVDVSLQPDKAYGVMRHTWNGQRDAQFAHFLRCITPSPDPALYFCHIVVPHFPWCYLPSGRKYSLDNGQLWQPFGAFGDFGEDWTDDDLAVRHAHQRYLLQAGYADLLIGELTDRLRATDLYDRSLIIVLADHGVSFRASESRRIVQGANLPDIVSIPLLVKWPGQHDGVVSDRNVESIDVLPTIASTLGLSPAPACDGVSLDDTDTPERTEKRFQTYDKVMKLDAAFEDKYQTLEHRLAMFGSGDRLESLYHIGPHSELVGEQVESFEVGAPSPVQIKLTRPDGPFRYEPDDPALVPCYLVGTVAGVPDAALPVELAIAVNGTVRAVTRTYRLDGARDQWRAMIPEDSLRGGANDVEIFVVTTENERPTLHLAWRSPDQRALAAP